MRDFTEQTRHKIEKMIDEYFDNMEDSFGVLSGWLSYCTKTIGAFFGHKSGDYRQYVKTLGSSRAEAKNKLKNLWQSVADVEANYSNKFNSISVDLEKYNQMILHLSECIKIENFSTANGFITSLKKIQDDLLSSQEIQVKAILKKGCSNYTDEDMEILTSVYMETNDERLKAEILNSFYQEKTEVDCSGHKVKAPDGYKFYELNEEQYKKFNDYTTCYFAYQYEQYLNGERSDADINNLIKSWDMANNFKDTNIVISKNGQAITLNDNQLEYNIPNIAAMALEDRNSNYTNKNFESNQQERFYTKQTYTTDFWIANGKDGHNRIGDSIETDAMSTYEYDVGALIGSYMFKGMDAIIPGSGKLSKTVLKYQEKVSDLKDNETQSDYQKFNQSEYIDTFEMKCANTSSGYLFLPTYETKMIMEKFHEFLNGNKDNIHIRHLYDEYYDSTDELADFLQVDPYELMSDLEEKGVVYKNGNWVIE